MKRPVLIILVILFAVTASVAGFFLAQPNPMTPRVKQLELELSKAQAEITRLKTEYDKLLASKKPDPQVAHASDATKPPADDPKAGPATSPRRMMETSDLKEVKVNLTFGRLFQQLGLNDKERDNLKQLLSDRQARQSEFTMKMMDTSLTAGQRQAVETEWTAAKAGSDAAIHQFLNNEDDYKTFQHWDDTQPEQMQLQLGDSNFNSAGVPLSDEQRNQLIDLMASVRNAPNPVPDANDPRAMTPESLTDDGIARQLARQTADNQRVLQAAASFLDPEQLDALKNLQQQMLTMTEAGMRMSRTMFGGKK